MPAPVAIPAASTFVVMPSLPSDAPVADWFAASGVNIDSGVNVTAERRSSSLVAIVVIGVTSTAPDSHISAVAGRSHGAPGSAAEPSL